jgi:uncharacterized protein
LPHPLRIDEQVLDLNRVPDAERASEAQRRSLTEAETEQIVRTEVADRQAAARGYDQIGQADQAGRLRREAQVLLSVIDAAGH